MGGAVFPVGSTCLRFPSPLCGPALLPWENQVQLLLVMRRRSPYFPGLLSPGRHVGARQATVLVCQRGRDPAKSGALRLPSQVYAGLAPCPVDPVTVSRRTGLLSRRRRRNLARQTEEPGATQCHEGVVLGGAALAVRDCHLKPENAGDVNIDIGHLPKLNRL